MCFNGAAVRGRRRGPHPGAAAGRGHRALQWGRRPGTAESRWDERAAVPSGIELQWGRRPGTAERLDPAADSEHRDPCFNGAAVRGRRRDLLRVRDRLAERSSFNGAAVRGRRREPRPGRGANSSSRGFNGAAVRGRRRGQRPVVAVLTRRASMGPPSGDGGEPNTMSGDPLKLDPLQWGRRPGTAESRVWRFVCGMCTVLLQWGRRPGTAESWCRKAWTMTVPWLGFNGAAVRGRRRGAPTMKIWAPRSRFNGAAVRGRRRAEVPRKTDCVPDQASMGPPSGDGGEPLRASANLHLGRRFNGAAVRGRRRGRAFRAEVSAAFRGFNGAAVRGRRRGGLDPRTPRRRRHASMGPPSGDGGEDLAGRTALRAPTRMLQWGRRPGTAESRAYVVGSLRAGGGFNGAAVRGRRRAPRDCDHVRARRQRFNGAAVRGRRRGPAGNRQ